MDANLLKLIQSTKDQDNYLVKSFNNKHEYFIDFLDVYNVYSKYFSKILNDWLGNKMLLNKNKFDEKQFIQFACEASIVKYFSEKFAQTLEIEKKVNPTNGMDVDLSFSSAEFIINIDVKCSAYDEKEKIDKQNKLKIQTVGRLPDLDNTVKELTDLLAPVFEKLNLDGAVLAKNMDNNLKSHLKSAHDKFNPNAPINELNVLAVCCNDAEDLQLWYYYMFKDQGLFTSESYWNQSEYENVDLVLINNLYFKHHKVFDKKITNSWNFDSSFNLIFENPFAKQKKEDAIKEFLRICPNFNREFRTWNMPGTVEEDVKDSRRIADFIKAELEEKSKIYLFEQP